MSHRLARLGITATPSLFAAAFVLTVYADTGAVLYALPRALTGAIAIALVVQLLGTAITRSLSMGAFIATGALVAVVDVRFGLVVLALLIGSVYASRIRRPMNIIGGVSFIVGVLFILAAVRAITSEGFVLQDLVERSNGNGVARGSDPDVYLILMDAYPRSDTLAHLGYDNGQFEEALKQRGFDIATKSTSSYTYTSLTLASMFNMAQLPDIPGLYPAPDSRVAQTRLIADAINHNRVLETFEERGYWTVSAGLTEVRGSLRAVDEYLDAGEVRLWERQVMQRTELWPFLCRAVVVPQHRSLVTSTFDQIEATAELERDDPVFMFAHVMSPHTPLVFDPSGAPLKEDPELDCGNQFHIDPTGIGLSSEEFGALLAGQIQFLNGEALNAVDAVIEGHRDAVIVLFSDHGARYSKDPTEEWFHTFFAARVPGQSGPYSDSARPVDIFPTLLNEYFGMSVPQPDARRFLSVNRADYPLAIDETNAGN